MNKNILKKHFKILMYFYFGCMGITALISFLLPKEYMAKTTIFQPTEEKFLQLKTQKSAKSKVLLPPSNTELFLSILKSRSMQNAIIKKFNLQRIYRKKTKEQAREELNKRVKIGISPEKMITVVVIDNNPRRVCDIANFYPEFLNKKIQSLNIITAKRNRIFIEERLKKTISNLRRNEEKLKEFQVKNEIFASNGNDNLNSIYQDLNKKLIEKELHLKKIERYLTPEEVEVRNTKKEIEEIKTLISRLPYLKEKISQLLREIKTQEKVYSFLTAQLEEAKIEESRDTPVVQVLDKASIPEEPYSPDIPKNLLIVTLIIFGFGVILIFIDSFRLIGNV